MAVPSKREKFFFHNNLVCLVKAVEGKYTTVDFRNDSYAIGKIDHVDGFMNIVMSSVIFYDTRGNEYPFDSFFIQARNIRYVHIPNELPIVPTIKNQLSKMVRNPRKPQSMTQRTVKGQQLLLRQRETLLRVQELKRLKEKKKQEEAQV